MGSITIVARDSKHLVELKRKYLPVRNRRKIQMFFRVNNQTYEKLENEWKEYLATHPWFCPIEGKGISFLTPIEGGERLNHEVQ